MNFAIEDSSEQSAFRAEVREFLARSLAPHFEHSVDPCDMSYEQYQIRRDLGRKLRWDPAGERFVDDEEANKLLARPRRKGYEWPKELMLLALSS